MIRVICLFMISNLLINEVSLFDFALKSSKLINVIKTSSVEQAADEITMNPIGTLTDRFDDKPSKGNQNDLIVKQSDLTKSDLTKSEQAIDTSNHMVDFIPNQLERMLNDDYQIMPDDEPRSLRDALDDFSSLDTEQQTNDEASEYVTEITSNLCEKDMCRSANATNSNFYNVDCLSINNDYNCYYCPTKHILIRHKHTCAGPYSNDDERNRLIKLHNTHVECLYGYLEDERNPNLCIKENPIKQDKPLSISYLYPNVSSISNIDLTNRTLIHAINLTRLENICAFEMKVEKIDDQTSEQSNRTFEIETKPEAVHLYFNSVPFRTALVAIECTYKRFILHRTELHFNQKK